MSKNKTKRAAVPEIETVFSSVGLPEESVETGRFGHLKSNWRQKLLYPAAGIALLVLVGMGVMAKNGWLPATDAVTGKRSGWFGAALPQNASSSWNPMASPVVTATPQLSKEYIYAGSRLLAVEDANATATPPADLAIWRPSNGQWWVLGGTGSTQTTVAWGSGTGTQPDKPVLGDYDGDGKTDFSIFRPSTGEWWIIKSSTGDSSSYVFGLGVSSDQVAQADYDGDGRTDQAVFRPSTGTWYIFRSSDSTMEYGYYGTSGDKAAPADYDGDGKADLAVWRSTDTSFYIKKSNGGYTGGQLSGGTEPVPADYDGDGKADMAVRSGTNWIIYQSSNNQSTTVSNFGITTDKAVQNDYDADGKVDIAVWRDSNGTWYIRQSSRIGQTDEVRIVQWGVPGDIPVPAFYRR